MSPAVQGITETAHVRDAAETVADCRYPACPSGGLQDRIDRLEDGVNARFDRVDRRMDRSDSNAAAFASRIEDGLDALGERVDAVRQTDTLLKGAVRFGAWSLGVMLAAWMAFGKAAAIWVHRK